MSKTKIVIVALLFALAGFMLNPQAPLGAAVFGSPPEGGPEPSGAQVGAIMLVALIEAVAFGVGIAFLLFARTAVQRAIVSPGLATGVWLAVTWFLVSWVPHTALHQTAGEDFAKLVVIEYAFHVTLVLGAGLVALALVRSKGAVETSAAHARSGSVDA